MDYDEYLKMCEERDKEKNKKISSEQKKRNRICIYIFILIIGLIMLFNAKCNHSPNKDIFYDDDEIEYRHT